MERPDTPTSGTSPRRCKRRQALRAIGIELPEWEDERMAPALDEEELRRLVEGRAEENERHRIAGLILRFRSWAEAYCRLAANGDGKVVDGSD